MIVHISRQEDLYSPIDFFTFQYIYNNIVTPHMRINFWVKLVTQQQSRANRKSNKHIHKQKLTDLTLS